MYRYKTCCYYMYVMYSKFKMSTATYLQEQAAEYQCHVSHIKELSATIEQQQNMEVFNTIPKDYKPLKQLKTTSSSLNEEFTKEYNKLFFRHLHKVITKNQIELQLHSSALISIIVQTERYLSKLPLPAAQVTTLYHEFLNDNDIQDRVAIPELQVKLQEKVPQSNAPPKKRRRPKRKCPAPTPDANKYTKEDHFLSQGSHVTQTNP